MRDGEKLFKIIIAFHGGEDLWGFAKMELAG
jgi:hypothetical protein